MLTQLKEVAMQAVYTFLYSMPVHLGEFVRVTVIIQLCAHMLHCWPKYGSLSSCFPLHIWRIITLKPMAGTLSVQQHSKKKLCQKHQPLVMVKIFSDVKQTT